MALLLGGAAPALAATVTYEMPEGRTFSSQELEIRAHVYLAVGKIILEVSGPTNAHQEVDAEAEACQLVVFKVTLPRNGSYNATITTTDSAPVPPGGAPAPCQTPGDNTRSFFVAAPPRRPAGVKAVAGPDRAVTVSWTANPEPDITGYNILRAQGAEAFQQVGSTGGTSYKDTAPSDGDYRYQVVAVRRGSTSSDRVASPPSDPAGVRVGGEGVAGQGVQGAPGDQQGARGAGRVSGGGRGPGGNLIDLGRFRSEFERLGGGTGRGDEGGYDRTLPYDEELTELGTEDDGGLGGDLLSDGGRRAVMFVAGGLLLAAVAAHVWWVRRESAIESQRALTPDPGHAEQLLAGGRAQSPLAGGPAQPPPGARGE